MSVQVTKDLNFCTMADCTPRCHSLQHASDIISVVTRGTESQVKGFLSTHCHNSALLKDNMGRTALHIAASCGKKGVVEWLIENKGADPALKDKESGWTALHRSMFYGYIDCVMSLLKHGSNLFIQDKEGFSTLDLAVKDRPAHVVFQDTDPTEIYTWGDNTNFTLGHGSSQTKHHPELVDYFGRTGIYVKQVVLCEFHSVFLSQKGQVYTCGHGQGGRLGHGDEQTCLIPRVVEGLINHQCCQVAAAKDHTVVLTEDGYVYTFGLNTFHQLGLVPSPPHSTVPRQVQAKNLKCRAIIGVAAGNFHTVLWTKEGVYTMGLNGGQLGYLLDPNGEKCISVPRQVSALHHKETVISFVSASDGATVCATEKGDIYLLTEYQCKKISSRHLNLKKVLVSGGFLNHKVCPQVLKEGGGQNISVLILDEAGRVFCWRSTTSATKQCRWAYSHQMFMSNMTLNEKGMMFITHNGEGFTGVLLGDGKKNTGKKDMSVSENCNLPNQFGLSESSYERIRLEKLSVVHRAVGIATDCKGRNFAVLQSDPKTSLYEIPSVSASCFTEDFGKLLADASEMDNIHNVTFQVINRTFPVHKYILAMRSDYFRKLFFPDGDKSEFLEICHKEDAVGCDLYVLQNINPDHFACLLQYIYTDTCDFLIQGYKPRVSYKEHKDPLICNLQDFGFLDDLKGSSAYKVYRNNQVIGMSGKKQKTKNKDTKKDKGISEESNPLKMLQVLAKKFGLSGLSGRLDGVRLENGKIHVIHKLSGNKPKFTQNKYVNLCDVTLRSKDGKEFACHKCVLCARMEYFHSMLCSTWIEASSDVALQMPINSDVLQVLLDYIYTDEAPSIKESESIEFLCNVLVVADQLLVTRLKEMCEVAITERFTLKNAADVLEFAAMYNAEQLKLSCFQFIGLNMPALLEARSLEVLSDDVLKELSDAYRKMIPAMQRRVITPYLDGPDISYLTSQSEESALLSAIDMDRAFTSQEILLKKAKVKAKKKPRKRSENSGGYILSDIIQSPPSTGWTTVGKTNSLESLQEFLTSDSEGSCVGVGSPRDLQSPDFLSGLHIDKSEVDYKAFASETKSSFANENVKVSKEMLVHMPSSPQIIPQSRYDANTSPIWAANIISPTTPPALNLRAIMEMEENEEKCRAVSKTSSSGNKLASHGAKLSQKQRKMIATAAKETSSGVGSEGSPSFKLTPLIRTTPTKKTGCPWTASLPCSPPPKSSHDVVLQDEKIVSSSHSSVPDVKNADNPKNEKPSELPSRVTSSPSEANFPAVSKAEVHNPWTKAAVVSPPAKAPVTFATIVEEELQQEAALVRSREKPLALIQIEERAIQDLLKHYEALDNPDEFIHVERAPQGPLAAPMWNRQRLQSC
ncbi:inhibitor of Bruton tyrosine kinase [Protopterus annectens]|uniref:inhibitor of Bruton tyrosine kinase n=1 Tax=Protopterus annectens TaxID=7888 RepID=UPI001CFC0AD4|nr:inhibitor of Bruton tyrosine kinase [Protopterus annectens]